MNLTTLARIHEKAPFRKKIYMDIYFIIKIPSFGNKEDMCDFVLEVGGGFF